MYLLLAILVAALPARAEWKNSSEAGVVIVNGNSRSQSINLKDENSYGWDKNTVAFRGNFLQSKSFGVLNSKRWDATLRYERTISERLSLFVAQGVESDRFAGFMQRYNTDIGPKYVFLKDANGIDWIGELGYRYSRERRVDGSRISKNQARAFSQVDKKWTESTTSRLWVEYLPNFSDSRDWLLNSELSTSAAFTTVLSLKVAYLLKYDNLPAPMATTKTDSQLTTSLVATY